MGLDKIKSSDETPEVIDWSPQWSTGAPCPQVISSDSKTYLLYYIQDDSNLTSEPVALITFTGHTYRVGIAGDEVQHGLPLWNKGLEHYSAHIIHNSSWIEEIKTIQKVHDRYDEARWKEYKHYALLFKDQMFEIIARDVKTEIFHTTFKDVATEVIKRIL